MRKAVLFCAGLLVGAVLMFVATKNTAEVQARTTPETFTQFIERLDAAALKEVTYTGGSQIEYVTTDGKSFVTTAPPPEFAFVGLTEKLLAYGVAVKATQQR